MSYQGMTLRDVTSNDVTQHDMTIRAAAERPLCAALRKGLPQLATPSLVGTAGEAVDNATLAFLLSQSLAGEREGAAAEERGGGEGGPRVVETAPEGGQG